MSSFYEVYEKARKLAESCVRSRKNAGLDPDLPVLDLLLKNIPYHAGRPQGLQEILTSRIAGTCHEGRTESFAWNYMPLLDSDSEFAAKWMNLYKSAYEEGLRDPISVYEVYGRYFTEEGNKRVSVTKYMGNPQISAYVRTLILELPEGEEKELYEEYLHFCSMSGVDCILMTRRKNYKALLRILKITDTPADKEQSRQLRSFFYLFESCFSIIRGTAHLQASSGDAFLLFLSVYGYQPGKLVTQSELEKELQKLWPDIAAYPQKKDALMLTETPSDERRRLLSDLFREPLRVCFIESLDGEHSVWSREHEAGIQRLKETLGKEVEVSVISQANTSQEVEAALNKAVDQKAEVVFTTNPTMLQITSQFAAKYPRIRFLNCSLNPDTGPLRTYFAREYEIEFLLGLAAGILSGSSSIGYIADYPIYGVIAGINAFAIGVQMVRPDAKIYLDWSTTQSATLPDFPKDIDMLYLAGSDFDPRIQKGKKFGLFDVRTGKFLHLADFRIYWDIFYIRICRSILNGSYDREQQNLKSDSINYWLGLSNGLLSVDFSSELPLQSRRMIAALENAMRQDAFHIFTRALQKDASEKEYAGPLSYEEIASMNWLNENIRGSIPREEQLTPEAEDIVVVHGIDEAEDHPQQEDEIIHPENLPEVVPSASEPRVSERIKDAVRNTMHHAIEQAREYSKDYTYTDLEDPNTLLNNPEEEAQSPWQKIRDGGGSSE